MNVVRDRPNIADLKKELKGFGADEVYTEEEVYDCPFTTPKLPEFQFKKALPQLKVRLAFDCVGGESSLLLSSALQPGGTLVNYGAMAGAPVQASPRDLIFKDIQVRGFWINKAIGTEVGGSHFYGHSGQVWSPFAMTLIRELPSNSACHDPHIRVLKVSQLQVMQAVACRASVRCGEEGDGNRSQDGSKEGIQKSYWYFNHPSSGCSPLHP